MCIRDSYTSFGNPRRTVNGLDFNRLLLTVAVLTRRVGLRLAEQDIFANVVGGLQIEEPAVDLAVALALTSSIRDQPVPADLAAVGEVGLSGEVRSVGQLEARLNEAVRLGFGKVIIPRRLGRTALRIPEDQVHFPDPRHLDAIVQRMAEVGGVDTCYGGIGYHGHLAFNEPPISRWYKLTPDEFRASLTRIVPLAPETIVMNSIRATGGNPAALPPMAVTLGMADILAARRLRLYCQGGAWQRSVLRIALLGEKDVDYPVTLAQGHPDYAIVTTQDTAQPPIPGIAA